MLQLEKTDPWTLAIGQRQQAFISVPEGRTFITFRERGIMQPWAYCKCAYISQHDVLPIHTRNYDYMRTQWTYKCCKAPLNSWEEEQKGIIINSWPKSWHQSNMFSVMISHKTVRCLVNFWDGDLLGLSWELLSFLGAFWGVLLRSFEVQLVLMGSQR